MCLCICVGVGVSVYVYVNVHVCLHLYTYTCMPSFIFHYTNIPSIYTYMYLNAYKQIEVQEIKANVLRDLVLGVGPEGGGSKN